MKSAVFIKTKRQIVFTSIGIVLISLFLFALILILFYRVNLYSSVDQKLRMDMNILMKSSTNSFIDQDVILTEQMPFGQVSMPSISNPQTILLIYSNDAIIYESDNRYFASNAALQLNTSANQNISNFQYNGYSFRYVSFTADQLKYVLLINIDSENGSFLRLCNVLIFSLVILTVISYFLSVYLANHALRPIKKSYDQQVQFVQDASHEMRTPLSIMKGKVELLAVHSDEAIELHADLLSDIMSELCGMEKLNNDLLLLSKEAVDISVNRTDFYLTDFISDLSDYYTALADTQNKIFRVAYNSDVMMHDDYAKMKRSVILLLENAYRYTHENDRIDLSFQLKERVLRISVRDTGIGIRQEDQTKIFERFYRSADVRGMNIEGSGIGLSILQSLSRTLGFRIELHSEYKIGTEFVLIYPLR